MALEPDSRRGTPPLPTRVPAQLQSWGKCTHCFILAKGYCRQTCGYCSTNLTALATSLPCVEDAASADGATANPLPDDAPAGAAGTESFSTSQAAPSNFIATAVRAVPLTGGRGLQTQTPHPPAHHHPSA